MARALSRAPLAAQHVLTGWAQREKKPWSPERSCPVLLTSEPCLMPAWKPDWRLSNLSCFNASNLNPKVREQLDAPLESQCF